MDSLNPLLLAMIGLIVTLALAVHGAFASDPFYGSNLVLSLAEADLAIN